MIALLGRHRMVLRVGLVLLWVRLGLRLNNLPLMLDQLTPRSTKGKPDDVVMRRLVGYLDRWLRLFPYSRKGNCFPRSLALYRLSRQLGYPVVFRCGVRKEAASLDGHAWLTLGSQVFYEPGTHWKYYTITFSYPLDLGAEMDLVSAHSGQRQGR